AERLTKIQDPLALMANSNNPYAFLVPRQDQSSFNQNYMQQPKPNPEDITDSTTTMNMALALMAKTFKLNYSSPTNNNQRISSNPRNRQIAQPARAEGNAAGQDGNQIRCYNCRGVGHFARNCTVRPRRRDAAYLQTQLLIAQKEEAGIQLQAKEFDLMAAAADLDEIEEVNANCILMANLQQASTSGTQSDKAPVYDADGSAEVKSTIVTLQRVVKHRITIEPHNWSSSAHQELHKIVKDEIFPIVNQVDARVQNFEIQFLKEAAKFVGDFKSLANEADESLAMHKALELEIERLLKAVVSQDIMNIVQKESVVDTSDLQTGLERTKERFENCIIKKENEYAKLWNDWYKKCDECKYDKISYDKAYNDMQQKFEWLQAQLGDLKADLDEIEEVNANCILMANLQQTSTSGTQSDKAPVYDADGSAEVHENCDENEIFNMFTQEEQYTELLEPIPESHQVPQIDNNVISEEETLQLVQESREKMKQLNKEIKPANYTKINHLSGVFVPESALSREEIYFLNISKTANVSKSISIPNEDLSDDTTPSVARKFLNEVKSTIVTLQRVVKQRMTIETHNWASSAHQEFHKIVREEILPIVNQVDARVQNFEIQFLKEAAKFVGDFKSLAKEADSSLAKHKILELEIERLLKAVISQDIISIVQNAFVVDTS
nr:hypothetical protein [Tanacetum cinerariifolium]